jgi:hypothetical protein
MPKPIQHRGLIVQHRRDHRAQRICRLYHPRHFSLEPFLHSWSILGGIISLLAILQVYFDLDKDSPALRKIMLDEKARQSRCSRSTVLNTPAQSRRQ